MAAAVEKTDTPPFPSLSDVAPPEEAKPWVRPAPSQATPRECGFDEKHALPLARYVTRPRTNPIFLGEGLEGSRLTGTAYATSDSPRRMSPAGTSSFEEGPNASADSLTSMLQGWQVEQSDNFESHPFGKTPVEIWATNVAGVPLRVAYTSAHSYRETAWQLNRLTRTASTPDDAEARFVRAFEAHRYAAFALFADFRSDCSAGAVADVLGKQATMGNYSIDSTGMLSEDNRDEIQKVLIRDGAKLSLAILSNSKWAEAESIMASTECAPENLAACADALRRLGAAANEFMAAATPSEYASLTSGRDPSYSVTTYAVSKASILEP